MLARRDILKGFAAAPLVGAPLAAVLANPDLARAAADSLTRHTARLGGGNTAFIVRGGVPVKRISSGACARCSAYPRLRHCLTTRGPSPEYGTVRH